MEVNDQFHTPAALLVGTPWIGGWVGQKAVITLWTRTKSLPLGAIIRAQLSRGTD
jgi:hypothetical protein